MTDRRNSGYHHIREDYEIRSKQELNKKLKDRDSSNTIEYSENSADEWDIKSHLESSDDNIVVSPSR